VKSRLSMLSLSSGTKGLSGVDLWMEMREERLLSLTFLSAYVRF